MNFKALCEANKTIKTTDIKGKEYAEVNQRIKVFRMLFPNGSIETEIVSLADGVVVIKATVKDEAGFTLGTGLAYEKESSSFINKTSYIENCETSAVGRALGMVGIGIDVSVASYEEVANAIENQNKQKATTVTENYTNDTIDGELLKQLEKEIARTKLDLPAYLKMQNITDLKQLTKAKAQTLLNKLEKMGDK